VKLFLLTLLTLTISCSKNWNYQNQDNWSKINEKFKFCSLGLSQSPIDVKGDFKKEELIFSYQKVEAEKVKNAHNLQINFYNRAFVERIKKKYFLRNINFHHPSEHQINGENFSLEMQIAHKSEDEQWLILAVFLEVGAENKNFDELINFVSSSEKLTEISLEKLINFSDLSFFYNGSFTTPPCGEGVKWYVIKTPIKISKQQANKIIKSAIFTKPNNRKLQKFSLEKY
jgi:carbonic anhydrase